MSPDINVGVSWVLIIQLLIATVLPLLVGLVTKFTTSGGVKAMLLALLAVISSGLTELLTTIIYDLTFNLGVWLVSAITSFVVAVSTHYGLWKPVGTTSKVQAIGDSSAIPPPPQRAGP